MHHFAKLILGRQGKRSVFKALVTKFDAIVQEAHDFWYAEWGEHKGKEIDRCPSLSWTGEERLQGLMELCCSTDRLLVARRIIGLLGVPRRKRRAARRQEPVRKMPNDHYGPHRVKFPGPDGQSDDQQESDTDVAEEEWQGESDSDEFKEKDRQRESDSDEWQSDAQIEKAIEATLDVPGQVHRSEARADRLAGRKRQADEPSAPIENDPDPSMDESGLRVHKYNLLLDSWKTRKKKTKVSSHIAWLLHSEAVEWATVVLRSRRKGNCKKKRG
jgi:hypothetical protein